MTKSSLKPPKNLGLVGNESLTKHTYMRTGGSALFFAEPKDSSELSQIIEWAYSKELPVKVIGGGSNLLVSDEGINGLVLSLKYACREMNFTGKQVTVGAGVMLPALSKAAAKENFGGLEFAIGIPGTVGGALCNNAGIADGQNFGALVEEITVLQKTTISKISKSELQFNYRSSNIKNHAIILSAILNLQFRKKIECELEMRKLLEHRQKTQPTSSRNAGSMFKNPTNQYAGALIEKSGCKGLSVGNASVSRLHANFIVHNGEASTEEIIQLMEMVSQKVFEYCGIQLEPEVEWWGDRSISKLFK
ncbi:MAG: UDP-N-acetylmuramate dehydrogenase [Dehalococcoidia bacterium]